jgi:hypothetical protein
MAGGLVQVYVVCAIRRDGIACGVVWCLYIGGNLYVCQCVCVVVLVHVRVDTAPVEWNEWDVCESGCFQVMSDRVCAMRGACRRCVVCIR